MGQGNGCSLNESTSSWKSYDTAPHDGEVWDLIASGKARHQRIETISSTMVVFSVEDWEWHKRKKHHHRILSLLLLSSPFATSRSPAARGER